MTEQPSEPISPAKLPEADPSEMTPGEQAEARRYGRISLTCSLADSALDLAYLGVMTFVVATPLDNWLAEFPFLSGSCSYLRLIALLLIVAVGVLVMIRTYFIFMTVMGTVIMVVHMEIYVQVFHQKHL